MPKKMTQADRDRSLREHLLKLLTAEQAHVSFDSAIKNLSAELRGKRPQGADHSPWELLEHLRIAQEDILDFSLNPNYKALDWPSGYWPATPAPPDEKAWDKSVRAFRKALKSFCVIVSDPATDLYTPIPHGDGQTILREAMLIADHNAYHVGQLVLVRQMLGAWG
ncbi:MAG TPA: DinB family protein [Terracidiphilus sp.]|nr:DinB family protein [Terracidiphilus sp.]